MDINGDNRLKNNNVSPFAQALIVIGRMGSGLIHPLLAGSTLILVVQLFSLLFPGDETMI